MQVVRAFQEILALCAFLQFLLKMQYLVEFLLLECPHTVSRGIYPLELNIINNFGYNPVCTYLEVSPNEFSEICNV